MNYLKSCLNGCLFLTAIVFIFVLFSEHVELGLFFIAIIIGVIVLVKIRARERERENRRKAAEWINTPAHEKPVKTERAAQLNDIPEVYFNTINDAVNNLVDFYDSIKNDKDLEEVLGRHVEQRNGTMNLEDQIYVLFCLDLKTCYTQLGHTVYLKSKEGLGFLIFMYRAKGLPPVAFLHLDALRDEADSSQDNLGGLLKSASLSGDVLNCFILADLLGVYDEDLQKNTLSCFIVLHQSLPNRMEQYLQKKKNG